MMASLKANLNCLSINCFDWFQYNVLTTNAIHSKRKIDCQLPWNEAFFVGFNWIGNNTLNHVQFCFYRINTSSFDVLKWPIPFFAAIRNAIVIIFYNINLDDQHIQRMTSLPFVVNMKQKLAFWYNRFFETR